MGRPCRHPRGRKLIQPRGRARGSKIIRECRAAIRSWPLNRDGSRNPGTRGSQPGEEAHTNRRAQQRKGVQTQRSVQPNSKNATAFLGPGGPRRGRLITRPSTERRGSNGPRPRPPVNATAAGLNHPLPRSRLLKKNCFNAGPRREAAPPGPQCHLRGGVNHPLPRPPLAPHSKQPREKN